MSREAAFVMGLARGDLDAAGACAREPLDENRVAHLFTTHQVGPLCHWAWRNGMSDHGVPPDHVPGNALASARHAYLHHSVRNEHIAATIDGLEAVFSERDVNALYLKGPWLAFRAYPEPGTRPIGDIDLCVHPRDYAAAVAALGDAGYEPADEIPDTPDAAYDRAQFSRQLRFTARGRPPVELHFRMINMGPPVDDERWVWDTSREVAVGPAMIRVPGPEAMMLHLLLHANQHGFAILRLLHDIRWAVARCPDLDWELLDIHVLRLRSRAAAYHALLLARDLAGAAVPQAALDAWRPARLRRGLYAWAWNLSQVRGLDAPRRRMETESPRFYLLEMGTWAQKWRYVRDVVRLAGGTRAFITKARRTRSPARTEHGRVGS